MRFDPDDSRWTVMARTLTVAVYEDFTAVDGAICLVEGDGEPVLLPKSAEPVHTGGHLLGRTADEVFGSDTDVLGAALLGRPGDPDPAEIAAVFAPIATMAVHSFVGLPDNPDKVGVTAGGVTANVDPAQHEPAIAAARDAGRVLDGLVGGWLPVLRFVYPQPDGGWCELLMFAPPAAANPRIQPVWYRVARVDAHGRLARVSYIDSYPPNPPRAEPPDPAAFYRDLLATRTYWTAELAPAMTVDVPDRRLADQARHSLVRARMTRIDDWPKYGVLERNYGGSEHDGFQDTFTVDVAAALDWGLFDVARRYIDNYLTHFVRDDGSLVYRGPGTGQYGRMLTVIARYYQVTGDASTLLAHRTRIDAIAALLRSLPREHGVIVGWCEADSCLEADPGRYLVPYLSNSGEAARGLAELGRVWQRIGPPGSPLHRHGTELLAASAGLRQILLELVDRSIRQDCDPPWLPVVAGSPVPFHVAVPADDHDPQFRAYRANAELLHSGLLSAEQVRAVVDYRAAHRDVVLGVPCAYGFSRDPGLADNRELAGFLSYGHAYGLLQHDLVPEFLLALYSLSAHQYTRGTWTAPETRRVRPGSPAAPYCVPAQLVVPLLLRWALVFEEPNEDVLWLAKAAPRYWFADGNVMTVVDAPTRWGPVGFRIASFADRVEASVQAPADVVVKVRLRLPDRSVALSSVGVWNPAEETITVRGSAEIVATLR